MNRLAKKKKKVKGVSTFDSVGPDIRIAKLLVKITDPQKMLEYIKKVYSIGYADGANAKIVDDDTRYFIVEHDVEYNAFCPDCNKCFVLDLEGFLDEEENKKDEEC